MLEVGRLLWGEQLRSEWEVSHEEFGVRCAKQKGRICLKMKLMHNRGQNGNIQKIEAKFWQSMPEFHLALGFSVIGPLLSLQHCLSLFELSVLLLTSCSIHTELTACLPHWSVRLRRAGRVFVSFKFAVRQHLYVIFLLPKFKNQEISKRSRFFAFLRQLEDLTLSC